MNTFATRLKELRINHGMKQSELAERFAVDQRTVSNWECGINEPNYEILIQLAKFFDVSADYLLGISD